MHRSYVWPGSWVPFHSILLLSVRSLFSVIRPPYRHTVQGASTVGGAHGSFALFAQHSFPPGRFAQPFPPHVPHLDGQHATFLPPPPASFNTPPAAAHAFALAGDGAGPGEGPGDGEGGVGPGGANVLNWYVTIFKWDATTSFRLLL